MTIAPPHTYFFFTLLFLIGSSLGLTCSNASRDQPLVSVGAIASLMLRSVCSASEVITTGSSATSSKWWWRRRSKPPQMSSPQFGEAELCLCSNECSCPKFICPVQDHYPLLLHHITNIHECKSEHGRSQIYLKHHKTILL